MSEGRAWRWVLATVLVLILAAFVFLEVSWYMGTRPVRYDSPEEAIAALKDASTGSQARNDAMGYLARQPTSVVSVMEEEILRSGSPEAVSGLFYSLGAHPSDEASAALLRLLDHHDSAIRELAARALNERETMGVAVP